MNTQGVDTTKGTQGRHRSCSVIQPWKTCIYVGVGVQPVTTLKALTKFALRSEEGVATADSARATAYHLHTIGKFNIAACTP